ncbi:MAG TPA: c-type cytochrome biogenesis protein CcmF, partial [Steroidobacteraceae bacterium]|nr:c-type cytochrome biogenesis protein CcmF [Steroidobacteraceae bacterium]
MLPELGHFALVLALLLAALQAFFGLAGPAIGRGRWMAAVIPATAGQAVMVVTAFACLVASFVGLDFSVAYVAQNANSALPLIYRIAAVWGAHEGSLLLWILLLAMWTVAVAFGATRLPQHFSARVLGVLGIVSFGFLLFTLATSNPFLRLIPAAASVNSRKPKLTMPS